MRTFQIGTDYEVSTSSPYMAAQTYAQKMYDAEYRLQGVYVFRIGGDVNGSGTFQAHTLAGEVIGEPFTVEEANER